MGLDITVYFVKKRQNKEESFSEFIVNDDLDCVKKYLGEDIINNKVHEYFNLEAIGLSEEDWLMTDYSGGQSIYTFMDKNNPYYKIIKELEKKPSELTEEAKEQIMNSGWPEYAEKEGYPVISEDKQPLIYFLTDRCEITFNEDDIPTIPKEDKVIYGEEIGYQRKGLNDLFYDEYKDEDYYAFTKERLQYIYDHYIDTPEIKEHFKKHILDKHVDGKTFVTFSW